MLPKKAISTFIGELNSRIPPPVHTAGVEDSRPVPAVLIDGISFEERNHHNSHFAGSTYDASGNVTSEVFRHYYTLRLELVVRDDDEVDAFDLLGQLQTVLDEFSRDPTGKLHNDVGEVKSLGSNGVSYQFYEPTETEINQSVVLETFYETDETDVDVIGSINDDFTFS